MALQIARGAILVLVGTFAVASSALAVERWHQLVNDELGFELQIPAAYELSMETSAGASRVYHSPDGDLLAVWGGALHGRDLRAEAAARRSKDQNAGWRITYERITQNWASYSGVQGNQIRYVRGIRYCGDRTAFFLIDYSAREKVEYDPIVTQMVRSFKGLDRC